MPGGKLQDKVHATSKSQVNIYETANSETENSKLSPLLKMAEILSNVSCLLKCVKTK